MPDSWIDRDELEELAGAFSPVKKGRFGRDSNRSKSGSGKRGKTAPRSGEGEEDSRISESDPPPDSALSGPGEVSNAVAGQPAAGDFPPPQADGLSGGTGIPVSIFEIDEDEAEDESGLPVGDDPCPENPCELADLQPVEGELEFSQVSVGSLAEGLEPAVSSFEASEDGGDVKVGAIEFHGSSVETGPVDALPEAEWEEVDGSSGLPAHGGEDFSSSGPVRGEESGAGAGQPAAGDFPPPQVEGAPRGAGIPVSIFEIDEEEDEDAADEESGPPVGDDPFPEKLCELPNLESAKGESEFPFVSAGSFAAGVESEGLSIEASDDGGDMRVAGIEFHDSSLENGPADALPEAEGDGVDEIRGLPEHGGEDLGTGLDGNTEALAGGGLLGEPLLGENGPGDPADCEPPIEEGLKGPDDDIPQDEGERDDEVPETFPDAPEPVANLAEIEVLEPGAGSVLTERTIPAFLDDSDDDWDRPVSVSLRDADRALLALAEARSRVDRFELLARRDLEPENREDGISPADARNPEDECGLSDLSATGEGNGGMAGDDADAAASNAAGPEDDPEEEAPASEGPLEAIPPGEAGESFGEIPETEATGWEGTKEDLAGFGFLERIARFGESSRRDLGAHSVSICDRDGFPLYTESGGAHGEELESSLLLDLSLLAERMLGLDPGRATQVSPDGRSWHCLIRGVGEARDLYAGFHLKRPLESEEVGRWTKSLAEAVSPGFV